MSSLLERIRPALVCPECKVALEGTTTLTCVSCKRTVRFDGVRWDFGGLSTAEEERDWLDAAKGVAKRRLGRLYPLAIKVLSPVYGDAGIDAFLRSFGTDAVVVNLGSGPKTYGDRVICVDGCAYEPVHVVCDLARLPFADGSIDGILSEAVLEHVPDPVAHVAEMRRVLRPGGRILCYLPFVFPFHASPHDYSRWTQSGLRRLFEGFTIEDTRVEGGPTAALVGVFQEWLAIALSFGNERLYRVLVPLTWMTSPLKYIDELLVRHPAAHVIAAAFAIEVRKP
jgi:SAM-dependent methyltransferase